MPHPNVNPLKRTGIEPIDRDRSPRRRAGRTRTPAIITLKAHIESGAPDAWKASVRVLELAFARPDNDETFRFPADPAEIEAMSWKQMTFLATSLTAPIPDEEYVVGAVIEENGRPR
jgi:hypothetical protein